jgi:hypothetical protein
VRGILGEKVTLDEIYESYLSDVPLFLQLKDNPIKSSMGFLCLISEEKPGSKLRGFPCLL